MSENETVIEFEPWVGDRYEDTRLLLLGESAYSWLDGERLVHPSSQHSIELVNQSLSSFPHNRFMNMLSRAVTHQEWPSTSSLAEGWAGVAFNNYVPGTVGDGPRQPPTADMWKRAQNMFPALLERLRPKNIIVLGKTMWSLMPETDEYLTDDVQVYRLSNGGAVVCWAVHHPSAGLGWERLSALVRFISGTPRNCG